MAFGNTPKDNANTPLGSVYVPGTANSDLTALEGIAINTDGNSQKSSAARMGMLDGDLVTLGTKTQTKATDGSVTSWSVIQLLKGIIDKLLGSLVVTGTFWQATQPVSGTFWQATQPVSGTVTANQGGAPWTQVPQAGTTGAATPSHTISAATTNATSLKASTGTIWGLDFANVNAAVRFVKLYDKASAPAVGTDTPVKTIEVPANGQFSRAFPVGIQFTNGIAWAATGAMGNADTTAIGAGDLSVDIDWK